MFHILFFVFLAVAALDHPAGTLVGKVKGKIDYSSKEECVSNLKKTAQDVMGFLDTKGLKVDVVGGCYSPDEIDKVAPPSPPDDSTPDNE